MSYVRKIQYKIEPMESYKVIRNCSGCGKKSRYSNTNNFRVNANGNKLDVWLIYQCEECKHTFNLGIYGRIKPDDIERNCYEKFLSNDLQLSKQYGIDRALFSKNRAEVDDKNIDFSLERISNEVDENQNIRDFCPGDLIEVVNDYGLKVRAEKIAASILKVSRTKLINLENSGMLQIDNNYPDRKIEIKLTGEISNRH